MPTGWETYGYGYGGTTWQSWNSTSGNYTYTITGGGGGGAAWNNWVGGTGGGYSTTSATWTVWVDNQVTRTEMDEAWAARVQRQNDEYAERQKRQNAAKERAKATFKECLTKKQRAEHEQFNSVTVLGSDGRTYLVKTGGHASGNVEVIEEGRPILRLCAHPRDYVAGQSDPLPVHDQFLAQILAIQHDAEAFCRTANVHWRRHPQGAPTTVDEGRVQPRDARGRFAVAA